MFRRTMVISTTLATGLSLAVLPTTQAAGQDSPWRTVASGLDSPRGLTFGPNGTLYVAEAGVGGTSPCFAQPPLGQLCFGTTGAVTQVKRGHQKRVLTGLPSFVVHGTPEVFGPSDVALRGNGNLYVTLGLGADPAARDGLPEAGQLAATLIRAKPSKGTFRLVADIGAFELSDNPDGGLPDSNPQGLLSTTGGQVVADAGGNSLLGVRSHGRISTLAVFPSRLVPNPLSGDTTGALIRLDKNGSRTVIASEGLTMPTGLAIRNGKAYVSNCGVCADIGEVIAIPLPGSARR